MEIRMVDTISQYHEIKAEVDTAIQEVVESGIYINGPKVKAFRENLASYLGLEDVIPHPVSMFPSVTRGGILAPVVVPVGVLTSRTRIVAEIVEEGLHLVFD